MFIQFWVLMGAQPILAIIGLVLLTLSASTLIVVLTHLLKTVIIYARMPSISEIIEIKKAEK